LLLLLSSIISKPGNERQWAMPIFQYLLSNSPFPYPSRSLKTTTKTAFRIENRVKFVKIRGYLFIKSRCKCKCRRVYLGLIRRWPHGIAKKHKKSLSKIVCICICNGFNQQIPPYFYDFHSNLISEWFMGEPNLSEK
jgi:hypothetical protein